MTLFVAGSVGCKDDNGAPGYDDASVKDGGTTPDSSPKDSAAADKAAVDSATPDASAADSASAG